MTYCLLALAIAVEVVATLALKASNGFTRFAPSLLALGGYSMSFVLLSLVLKKGLDLTFVYALWSAVGIVSIGVITVTTLGERLDALQVLGLALIVGGVLAFQLGARAHP